MGSQFINLEQVRVARPCPASWDGMQGDETTRFCETCRKHVYNLSGMSHGAAEKLIHDTEGELCIRYYQRTDGTVLTDDCPVGLRLARRPFKWLAAAFMLLLGSGAALSATIPDATSPDQAFRPSLATKLQDLAPIKWLREQYQPPPVITGAMASRLDIHLPE